jgi:A/G-specific adenine glycosylase
MNFRDILFEWYVFNKRELPWRDINNPYFIWLSEIILQQTRVEQGLPYYLKFTKAFPTVADLAKAKEDIVLKLWQGLGYYSRARNLHFSAKYIVQHYKGNFPTTYNNILNLKGVGTYTAAAIASFSFGLPHAVVDGNVIRFLSRFFGISTRFDTSLGKKKYEDLAQDLLDIANPGEYNQAIMEFGAIQCTPKSPKCSSCPFIINCVAYNTNSIQKLPLKSKKIKIKNRYLNYLLIQKDNSVILGKRNEGIWNGLYEFPFIEYSNKKSDKLLVSSSKWIAFFENTEYEIESVSHEFSHKLSHQHIFAKFWTVKIIDFELEKYSFVKNLNLKNYPVSRLTDKFLKEYNII